MTTLAQSLLAFQTDAPTIRKDATNPHFGSRFASLDNCMDIIRPRLNACGLIVLQFPTITETGHPALRTQIVHAESGDAIEDTMPLAISKPGPQEQGSAITYARRYALLSILGLVADEDDDGAAASANKSAGEPRRDTGSSESGPSAAASASPAESIVSKAKAAQEAKKAARAPQDDGNPTNIILTFGKHKGERLGAVEEKYLQWLVDNFQARTEEQRRIIAGANVLLGNEQEAFAHYPDDDIPF